MSVERIRLACLGCGFFSQFHYRAWQRIPEIEIVGIADRNVAAAEAVAARLGSPPVFAELPDMLDACAPELIDAIIPPHGHLGVIEAAAARGVDVICQKPFCRDLAEATRAANIAERAGIAVVVHENFRFQPWYGVIRDILRSHRLGRVYQAQFRLRPGDGQGPAAYLDRQPYFQSMPRLLIHETAIHLVDVFRFLFGEARSVLASLRRLNPVIAGEDSGIFIMDMVGDVRCVFDGNRLSDHAAHNRRLVMGEMTIEGEKGVLTLDGDATLAFRPHGTNARELIAYDWSDRDFAGDCVYRLQRHVVDARIEGRAAQNAARDYLDNLRVEEAIYASHANGCRVDLSRG
jgi:predicted dehydrogenase